MLNLDTHILIFAIKGELTERESRLLSENRWSISAIVLLELTKLVQLGRIEVDLAGVEFSRVLGQVKVRPLDFDVCQRTIALGFRSDPADEIIAATSLRHGIPLLTRNRRLLASKVVPLA